MFPPKNTDSNTMVIGKWLLIYFIFSIIAMYPSSLHMTTYKYGYAYNGSDSLGTINYNWSIVNKSTFNEKGELWTYYQGYPEGRKLLVYEPVRLLACLFTKIINPVFGYNIMIFASFLLAGLITHFLLFRLLNSHWISMFGGVTFMLSPFHMLHAADHFNLAQTWIFPAFFLLIIKAMADKSFKSLFYVALFILFSLLIHGYYAVYLGFISVAVLIYLVINKTIALKRNQLSIVIFSALFFAAVVFGVLYYMGIVFIENGSLSFYKRPIDDLFTYGIRWYEFFLPPYYSLFFKKSIIGFISKNHHGSNSAEMTLFLGYIPLFLSGYCALKLLKKSNADIEEKSNHNFIMARIKKNHLMILLIIGLLPFFLGVSPEIKLFGFNIPTLSKFMFYFLPMVRTLSRIGILTIFSITCFACFGLYFLVKNFPKHQKLIILVIIFGVYLEFTHINESYYADTDNVPPVYKALKEIKGNVVVFEMPFKWGYLPDFWQTYHQKPLFNFFGEGNSNFKKGLFLSHQKNLYELLMYARKEKIDYLIIHFGEKLPINQRFKNSLNKHTILPPGALYSYLIKVD